MKFIDPNGSYTGGYTSDTIIPNLSGPTALGIMQVTITSGTVDLQGKVSEDADWTFIKQFSDPTNIEYMVLAPYLRIETTGDAVAHLGEVR